jgi:phage terminase large subunit
MNTQARTAAPSARSGSSASLSTLRIPTARAFLPFLQPARYKGAHGGRGSGKSWFFAGAIVEACVLKQTRAVCVREVQGSLKDSSKQLITDIIAAHNLGRQFNILESEIRGPNDSLIIFRGMQNFNASNIKSLEGYDIAWVEEAQDLSQKSLDMLRPTIRKDGSEMWFSWNPSSEFDPIDMFLRGKNAPPDAIVRQVNWSENPWFPQVLRNDMERDRAADPAKASHVWDGEYQQAPSGAYYADLLAKARLDGRITRVPHDPALEVHVSFDLGVGQNQSLCFTQRTGRELRWIDYLEGNEEAASEGYSWYARKMRERPYTYAPLVFPHDGRVREATGKSRAETMEGLGFKVVVLPMLPVDDGIDAMKRILPISWIDETKCAPMLTAWKNYRENWDDKLRRSNGPLKDWTNHAADSGRYTAVAYEAPKAKRKGREVAAGVSWMG